MSEREQVEREHAGSVHNAGLCGLTVEFYEGDCTVPEWFAQVSDPERLTETGYPMVMFQGPVRELGAFMSGFGWGYYHPRAKPVATS